MWIVALLTVPCVEDDVAVLEIEVSVAVKVY